MEAPKAIPGTQKGRPSCQSTPDCKIGPNLPVGEERRVAQNASANPTPLYDILIESNSFEERMGKNTFLCSGII